MVIKQNQCFGLLPVCNRFLQRKTSYNKISFTQCILQHGILVQLSRRLCLRPPSIRVFHWLADQIQFYKASRECQETRQEVEQHTDHPSFVGEFAGALDYCTRFLNGVDRGSRWEWTYLSDHKGCCDGKVDPANVTNKDELQLFLEQQFYEFEENGLGWIFWCWKTERSLVWDIQRLAENNATTK